MTEKVNVLKEIENGSVNVKSNGNEIVYSNVNGNRNANKEEGVKEDEEKQ